MGLTRRAPCPVGVGMVLLVALAAGCGDIDGGPAEGDQRPLKRADSWTSYADRRWGYEAAFPSAWYRATRSLTPSIVDPVEILSVATFPLRVGDDLCGRSGALKRVRPVGALVTIQERGRGAHRESFPSRPERFRPDPALPGRSTWPHCVGSPGRPRVEMLDYWFGFMDAGRVFHVLVAIGKKAPEEIRDQAFRILDTLRFDPSVKPDWRSSP